MANNITGRVWTLDTVGVVHGGMVKVKSFSFVNYAADTDVAAILDRIGRVIWTVNGASDLTPVDSGDQIGWIEGITLSTLSAGAVLVYLE